MSGFIIANPKVLTIRNLILLVSGCLRLSCPIRPGGHPIVDLSTLTL